jgi:hypothetical protein
MLATTHAGRDPLVIGGVVSIHWQSPDPAVGTNATTGANIPARLSQMSSHSPWPLMAMRHSPIAINPPTNTERTGV